MYKYPVYTDPFVCINYSVTQCCLVNTRNLLGIFTQSRHQIQTLEPFFLGGETGWRVLGFLGPDKTMKAYLCIGRKILLPLKMDETNVIPLSQIDRNGSALQ